MLSVSCALLRAWQSLEWPCQWTTGSIYSVDESRCAEVQRLNLQITDIGRHWSMCACGLLLPQHGDKHLLKLGIPLQNCLLGTDVFRAARISIESEVRESVRESVREIVSIWAIGHSMQSSAEDGCWRRSQTS